MHQRTFKLTPLDSNGGNQVPLMSLSGNGSLRLCSATYLIQEGIDVLSLRWDTWSCGPSSWRTHVTLRIVPRYSRPAGTGWTAYSTAHLTGTMDAAVRGLLTNAAATSSLPQSESENL